MCGVESVQIRIGSDSVYGSPDLDFRMPRRWRASEWGWLQECPACGYVASLLSRETSLPKKFFTTKKYLSCDNRKFLDSNVHKFYKCYLIKKAENDTKSAFEMVLKAAWRCDDQRDEKNAIYCRKKALKELNEIIKKGEDTERLWLKKADIMRRIGLFEEMIEEFSDKQFSEEIYNKVIVFQMEKAKQHDKDCYNIKHVTGELPKKRETSSFRSKMRKRDGW
jgi:hypothetical protein